MLLFGLHERQRNIRGRISHALVEDTMKQQKSGTLAPMEESWGTGEGQQRESKAEMLIDKWRKESKDLCQN
jgi:hypothetical protein